jgi:hypothetical protein
MNAPLHRRPLLEPGLRIGDEYDVPDERRDWKPVRARLFAYQGADDARVGWFRPLGEDKGTIIRMTLDRCTWKSRGLPDGVVA